MRTTIEISDEMRAKLLALAAKRGLRGYSEIVNEALRLYLDREAEKEQDLQDILSLAGSLSSTEAEAAVKNIREFWEKWNLP